MAAELKPCPFCGGEAVQGWLHYYCCCKACGAHGPSFPEDEGGADAAASAWNTRAHLQQRPLPVREGTERDALRYRWLRDTGYWYTSPKGSPWAVIGTGAGDAMPCCGQELDAAIDAGMADMPPVASSPSVQNSTNGVLASDGSQQGPAPGRDPVLVRYAGNGKYVPAAGVNPSHGGNP